MRARLKHRSPAVTYAVDCRMLFMGDRVRLVPRAFEEVSYHFASSPDPARLFERLNASAEIRQFYEVRRSGGEVSVTLRDAIFREAAPGEDLDLLVEASDAARSVTRALPLSRWKALGRLLPLLAGRFPIEDLPSRLLESLSPSEAAWAIEFFGELEEQGFIEKSGRRPAFGNGPRRPAVTLLGHSSLLVRSRRGALLVDPVLRPDQGLRPEAFDVTGIELDAVLCSHAHWDHCDLQTLFWLDKDTPIFIPRVRRPTIFNPPIAPVLARMGFTDVREMEHWTEAHIGDFTVVPVPFHGEQDEPGAEIDHYTYVIRTEGLSLYGGVDSYRDTFGSMPPVLERVRREYAPDVAFLPISRMIYDYRTGGVNGFCRYLDGRLYGRSFQYTAAPEDAARWVEILQPKWVCPYAIFAFPRWSVNPEVGQFARALRKMGLEDRLFPLHPLDRIDSDALGDGTRSRLRRRLRLEWYRLGDLLLRQDRGLRRWWVYRFLRRAVSSALAERSRLASG